MASCYHPIDRLMATLRSRLPGAIDPLIDLEIINVIDEFFRRTNAWRWQTVIGFVEGEQRYDLDVPENTQFVRVMKAIRWGSSVAEAIDDSSGGSSTAQGRGRLTADELHPDGDAEYFPNRTVTQSGTLRYAIFYPDYLSVNLPPTAQDVQHPITIEMAISIDPLQCVPKDDSLACSGLEIPEWMYDTFFRAWVDGVQASMMSQISKPYSNPEAAKYHGRRFRNQMAYHKQEADRGFVYERRSWRFPSGGFITRG